MTKKKPVRPTTDAGVSAEKKSQHTSGAADAFLNGPNAKWVFFAIYLFVTIFLFRDFLFSDAMLFGGDTIPDGVYTRKYYKEYHEQYGGVPRWNPYVLGGLPFIDAMHGDTFYPGAWLKFFMPLTRALGHKLVWHVLLAGIMMYLFLRTLKLRRDASFLGGLMYMLAPSFVTLVYPGHDAKMYVIAWLPLAFTFLERGMVRPKLPTFIMLGAVMGLLVLTSHAQMAYYSYWAIGLYFLFRLFAAENRTPAGIGLRTAFFAGAVAVAVMLGAVQLLPAFKFSTTQSVRTGEARSNYEYATSWSMHPEEAAGMIVPSFQGNTFIDGRRGELYESDLYWGRNLFKLNSEYHGFLPILFAVLCLLACRVPLAWFMSGLSLMSLIYALGATTPIYRLFYALVPGVKTFRAPSMIIFLFCFAIVTMSAQFLSKLLDSKTSVRQGDRRLLFAAGGMAVAAILVSLMGRGFFDAWASILYRTLDEGKQQAMLANMPVFTKDLWRIVILVCVSLTGIWMYTARKIGAAALVGLLALVTILDQSVIDSRFLTVIDPATYPSIAPDNSVRELEARLKKDGAYRTLTKFAQGHTGNYYAMFGIPLADGFHNNELKTYEHFRGGSNSINFVRGWLDLESYQFTPSGIATNNFLKAAGVRYIIIPGQSSLQVVENDAALPRVYGVSEYISVANDSAAIALLANPSFDAAKSLAVEDVGDPLFTPVPDAPKPVIDSYEYTRDGVKVAASFTAPGFVVVSDNYVPYWTATIDGAPATVRRANGTFMAVSCGEGRHEIVFTYRSGPFETGKKLTFFSLAIIVVTAVFSGIMTRVGKKREAA